MTLQELANIASEYLVDTAPKGSLNYDGKVWDSRILGLVPFLQWLTNKYCFAQRATIVNLCNDINSQILTAYVDLDWQSLIDFTFVKLPIAFEAVFGKTFNQKR